MNILLTNDDSHISPLFHLAIDFLESQGRLTVVAPKEEQSWTGKSITRFSNLHVDEIRIHDHAVYCVDGTPAACVNLAIYNLMDEPPDLVVSGINMGLNTGISFAMSSGTLGACLEANIAGIPGIAISQELDRETYQKWNRDCSFEQSTIDRLRAQIDPLLLRVAGDMIPVDHLPDEPRTWNVNFPFNAANPCDLVHTSLSHTYYASIYKQAGDHYRHDLSPFPKDPRPLTDDAVIRDGHVSLTEIDILDLGRLQRPV